MLLLFTTSCARFPQDPHRTLAQVLASGTIQVGVIANEPWVTGSMDETPRGLEPQLITAFAKELGVEVEWHWGSTEAMFDALTHYELDVIIGGLTKANPWGREVAFTLPYYTDDLIVGVPPTVSPPTTLDGVVVAIPADTLLSDELEEQGAIPKLQEDLTNYAGPVATNAWAIAGMGWQPTEFTLRSDQHVMALPRGENAIVMRLETFLLDQTTEAQIADLLWKAATP